MALVMDRIGSYGEIAPSQMNYGASGIYPIRLEGVVYSSADQSLAARKAMRYRTALPSTGVIKDIFSFPIRSWDIAFTNLDTGGMAIDVYDRKKALLTSITVADGNVSTFVWAEELRKGIFGYNGTTNPIVGDSVILIGGINKPMSYLDDGLTLKNWRVLTNQSETARYITPIVEDFTILQNRLSILVPKALGTTLFEEELGIDSPWIYMSTQGVFDNFRQTTSTNSAIYTKPLNAETLRYYSITAFRNILGVVHSGGLSVVKAGDASGSEVITQINQKYYLADESEALPIKATAFNNVLMYLSRTGLRGRTLLEDPLTNQMTGFKIPVKSQRFTKTPTRLFKKRSIAQLCVFDGSDLFSFCEMVTTDKGGQLFPRTTYIRSDENIKVLAINNSSAVLEIDGNRFLVDDDSTDILSIGVIKNFYPEVTVIAQGTGWIELDIDVGIQSVMILVVGVWYKLIRSGVSNRFLGVLGTLPANISTPVQLIPLEGTGVYTLLPLAMRNPLYQWSFELNGEPVVISGDDVSIAVDTDPILVSASMVAAYALPLTITIASTSVQYGPYTAQDIYIVADRDVEAVGTFNHIPKVQSYVKDYPSEYSFKVSFTPRNRTFALQIKPTLGQTDTLVIEQVCCLT